jgi:hypothetical protein
MIMTVRLGVRVAVCAAAGFIVAIGVAAAAARWSQVTPRAITRLGGTGFDGVPVTIAQGFGVERVLLQRQFGGRFVGDIHPPHIPEWVRLSAAGDGAFVQEEQWIGAGWPVVCLITHRVFDLNNLSIDPSAWHGGVEVVRERPLQPLTAVVIPYTPYWPGLAINSAAFAATILALMRGFHVARRHTRGRANRCVSCGYDLRGLTSRACPECGVATRATTASP